MMSVEFSKEELEKFVSILENYGNILVAIGEIERKRGTLQMPDLLAKIEWSRIAAELEKDPEFSAKVGTLLLKFLVISSKLKRISELPADDKIEVGNGLKEISAVMKEILKG